jgi:hypothetical protein
LLMPGLFGLQMIWILAVSVTIQEFVHVLQRKLLSVCRRAGEHVGSPLPSFCFCIKRVGGMMAFLPQ